jgi:hypothetical protein
MKNKREEGREEREENSEKRKDETEDIIFHLHSETIFHLPS